MSLAVAESGQLRASFDKHWAGRGTQPGWLAALRERAMANFERRGWPTTRDEAWRFTNVAEIARSAFASPPPHPREAAAEALRLSLGASSAGPRAVFVNGRFAPELSSARGPGVTVESLAAAVESRPGLEARLGRLVADSAGAFAQLATAFVEDGALVELAPGTRLAEPLHVIFVSTTGGGAPSVSYPRLLLLAGAGSQATIVEKFGGPDGQRYLTCAVGELWLEPGAVVDHYRVQREGRDAFHLASLAVHLMRDCRYSNMAVSLGARLARTDIEGRLDAPGAECVLDGLYLVDGEQLSDTHTLIDHAQPHGVSRQLYKGIVAGRGRGVFHGKVLVRAGAQKTDAHQANKNLLLSDDALVHSTPALEILADDVKCKHGSTTGQLDRTALFYLRSRGIGEAAARDLLSYAFASDLLGRIRVEALRAALLAQLHDRLPGAPLEAIA